MEKAMIKIKRFSCGSLGTNCYAVIKEGEALLVDPGYPEPELLSFINDTAVTVKAVLLTHRHFDHVNAAGLVKKQTGCEIIISADDECGLYSDDASITSLCGYEYGRADENLKADRLVYDSYEFSVCGINFKTISTPGHTAGSVCYYADGMLFSGDTLFKNSIGRTDFPTGSTDGMFKSLKKLLSLPPETVVYPGHGDVTDLRREIISNPFMRNL